MRVLSGGEPLRETEVNCSCGCVYAFNICDLKLYNLQVGYYIQPEYAAKCPNCGKRFFYSIGESNG